ETAAGRVRAPVVVRATEGFTPELEGHRRTLAPIYSLMIATDPLPDSVWAELGWREREALAGGGELGVVAQRTGAGRIAVGGRGARAATGPRPGRCRGSPSRTSPAAMTPSGPACPG